VGIELEGSDFENFCDSQYQSLAILTSSLTAKYPIADVVGHQHIAPDRKTDPGPFFDWQRFQREFLAETLGQFGRASSQCVLRFPE
jgi:AmpD protein